MTTIRDVAQEAGVHPSTVSRVFSGKAKISTATRERVLAAAAALDFHPNAIARSLSVQRTHTIAIVVPHIYRGYFEDAFFPQVMRGLLEVAYQHNYRILVSGSQSHHDEITQTFEILGSRQADGIVVLTNRLDVDTVGALRRQETPFVLLGRPADEHEALCWVDTENERFSRQCVEYLLSLGHRRIAYVGGDPDVKVVRERLNGYQAAMRGAGIDYLPAWIDYGYFVEDGGYQAVQRMMALGDAAPTAYYAANDLMAIGVIRALRERGINVPGEVSVIGTNDAPEASHVYPSLTSLQVPYAEMAAEAATMLIRLIEDEPIAERQRLVDSVLVVRGSTGPLHRNMAGTNNHHSVHVR
mgnify:CR=1 FL=1